MQREGRGLKVQIHARVRWTKRAIMIMMEVESGGKETVGYQDVNGLQRLIEWSLRHAV